MKVHTKNDLVKDIRALGIREGELLNLKVSMGSIGYIVGGARTLIEALLEVVEGTGTIEAQAFVRCYPLPLSGENAKMVSDRWAPSYAGAMALVLMLAMSTLQPVIESIATLVGSIVTADGQWAVDFADNMVIPLTPILLPVFTFVVVYLKMSRHNTA